MLQNACYELHNISTRLGQIYVTECITAFEHYVNILIFTYKCQIFSQFRVGLVRMVKLFAATCLLQSKCDFEKLLLLVCLICFRGAEAYFRHFPPSFVWLMQITYPIFLLVTKYEGLSTNGNTSTQFPYGYYNLELKSLCYVFYMHRNVWDILIKVCG